MTVHRLLGSLTASKPARRRVALCSSLIIISLSAVSACTPESKRDDPSATRSPDLTEVEEGTAGETASADPSLSPLDPSSPERGSASSVEDCFSGAENCPCYENGSCNPIDGVPMICVDDRCVRRLEVPPGTLSGACDAQTPCQSFDGVTLSCIRGTCAIQGCPDGQLGCPCGPSARCTGQRGERAVCRDLFCVPTRCERGAEDCSCRAEGERCDEGLSCDLNVCRSVSQYPLDVTVASDIRACDVTLEVDEGKVELRADPNVLARHSRRGRLIGVSMISRQDAPLASTPVTLILDQTPIIAADNTRLIVVKATCYDRLGHPDPTAIVKLR